MLISKLTQTLRRKVEIIRYFYQVSNWGFTIVIYEYEQISFYFINGVVKCSYIALQNNDTQWLLLG